VATYSIRVIGDPVLTQRASEVQDIDGKLIQLIDEMFDVMYKAPGIGLAAPQIGVQKRLFVFDSDDEPGVLINPVIEESDDTWVFNEGCLSIPGLYFEIERPKRVLISGMDHDGGEIQREVDELQARMFQHELDHLDGTLMVDHLTEAQRKAAKKHLLDLRLNGPKKGPTVTIGRDGSLLGDD